MIHQSGADLYKAAQIVRFHSASTFGTVFLHNFQYNLIHIKDDSPSVEPVANMVGERVVNISPRFLGAAA